MDILAKLQSTYPNMTKAEKKLADFLLSEHDGHYFLHVTLSRISGAAGVGQATVMRLINSCGYTSYRSFMADLSQEKYRIAMVSTGSGKASLADEWVKQLRLCSDNLDRGQMGQAARLMCQAGLVVCAGYGNSSHVAALAASQLRRANLLAAQHIPGEIDFFNDKDTKIVLAAFSVTGETGDIVRLAQRYSDHGAGVIAITARTESQLSRLADFTFCAPSAVAEQTYGRLFDGVFNQLFVVETLIEEIHRIMYPKAEADTPV